MDYSRQTILPQWGEAAQQKLRDSRILVIGAGGLGTAIIPYLAAGGLGHLGIIDGDRIEASNLPRQVIYTESQIGELKVEMASTYLHNRYPSLSIASYAYFLGEKNAKQTLSDFDLVIDATDDIPTRYLIDQACLDLGIPWIYGSIHQFEGQVSVFNFNNGPSYRDLFPKQSSFAVNCSEAGVLGSTVGLVGMLQANEAMKIVGGFGSTLSGKLLVYNLITNSQDVFEFEKKSSNSTEIAEYQFEFISAQDAASSSFLLLDVRQVGESPEVIHERCIQIPISDLDSASSRLDPAQEVLIFCQSGQRSLKAAEKLIKLGFQRIKLIKGGAKELADKLTYEIEHGFNDT